MFSSRANTELQTAAKTALARCAQLAFKNALGNRSSSAAALVVPIRVLKPRTHATLLAIHRLTRRLDDVAQRVRIDSSVIKAILIALTAFLVDLLIQIPVPTRTTGALPMGYWSLRFLRPQWVTTSQP